MGESTSKLGKDRRCAYPVYINMAKSKEEQALLKKIDKAQEEESKWLKEGNRLRRLYKRLFKKEV